jgi:antitoxin component YwqK of YwqJK toxin-antitoxin module
LFVRVVDSTKNIIAFGALKNGNPDGLWMDLDNLGTYVNGRAHGFWSMKEGSIEAHGSFINGYREGLWIIKNTTTGKNEMVNYHKGKKVN